MRVFTLDAPLRASALVFAAVVVPFLYSAPDRWSFARADTGRLAPCAWRTPPPAVDGLLGDWPARLFTVTLDAAHMRGSNQANPPVVGGDRDCSGKVALAWDGTFLYVALQATDDVLAPVDRGTGYRRPWFHDGLMLGLHAHAGLQRTGRYGPEVRLHPSDSHVQIGLNYHQAEAEARSLPGRCEYVVARTSRGYAIEARIELAALGYHAPAPGDRLKCTMILVDRDPGKGDEDAFGQLIWQMGPPGTHTGPADWADLVLMRNGHAASVTAAGCDVDGCPHLGVKAALYAGSPGLVFRGARLRDGSGAVVRRLETSRNVPAGEDLSAVARMDVGGLSAGDYELALVVRAGDEERNGQATATVQLGAPRGPPAPPSPVYVMSPWRYQLSAKRARPRTFERLNRDAYLDILREHARRTIEPLMYNSFDGPNRHAHRPGFLAAYMYRETRDPFYAKAARAAFDSAVAWTTSQDKQGDHKTEWYWLMVDLMRESGLLADIDDARVREFLLTVARRACKGHYGWDSKPWRRGAGHSALGPAVARYYAVHRYPDIPEADLFRKYYELTWNDWWEYRDTIYNDTGYRSLFLHHVFLCAYLTGREDVFSDPEAAKFWERLLHTTAPCGAFPHYGDTNGWNGDSGRYAFFFEYLATKRRDGRFKWAAQRIVDYFVNHSVDMHDYHMQSDCMVYSLALAHMVADDSVEPKAPGRASCLLTRRELHKQDPNRRQEEFGHQVYDFRLGPEEVPDKIVFKSGDRAEYLWALIDVCGDGDHNTPGEPTNVAALIDRETVLTCNSGYMDETPDLHNVVFAEDLEGRPKGHEAMQISVPEFHDWAHASYARVRVGSYHGWPLDEERQFLFGRYRFLLLKDVVTFTDAWMCRLGPCWQTQQVGPEVGPHWANTWIENLFLTGLGTGGGFHRWRNPAWDLLVYHPPQASCRLEVVNRFEEQPWRMLPIRLRYCWEGMAQKGDRLHFTTLLLPHEPVRKPREIAEKIEVLADEPDLTALRVSADRYFEDWMVLNDTGGPVTVGDIETDARQLHLYLRSQHPPARRVMAEGVGSIRFRGETVAEGLDGGRLDKEF